MSVAEIGPRGEDFERTPPHDLAAEQCVLGGMMLSKDAISDVLEVIRPQDHYRPAHQVVHEVILDLYGRGEPADAVTVAAELTKRGDIGRVGGAPYLHTLIASVPTAANAGYYARIVRERALLRRLVEVGTRIVQLGYSGDGDADDLVDRAEAEVYGITERRVADDYLPLSEIMPGALHEIEAIGSRGGVLTGVPTGFADLDALTNGLHPGQMIVIAARPALGKALALDTPLPTPDGWTTMGEVQAGDFLIGADGRPTRVVAATEVMHGRPCYEIRFDDDTVIIADAGHEWRTTTWAARRQASERAGGCRRGSAGMEVTAALPPTSYGQRPQRSLPGEVPARASRKALAVAPARAGLPVNGAVAVVQETVTTTERLAATVQAGQGWLNHAISVAGAIRLPAADLPFSPYDLGVRLSANSAAAGIPQRYLRSSQRQRRDLLAGLLDAGGSVTSAGSVQLSLTSRKLAEDVRELVLSLGYRCERHEEQARSCSPATPTACTVTFTTSDDVFGLPRKRAVHQELRPGATAARARYRFITSVRVVRSQPVRCVQVDAADHMYLAGQSMIPTHNSTLALDFARAASIKNDLTAVLFSLEMSRNEITMRLLSAEARVPLHSMRTGQMSDEDWTRLARRMSEVVNAPLFIDDSPNMSMMEIRAKCRRLKQRQDLRLVIIDYLQLMTSPRRVENRQQEVSDMSRSLKLLAKELDVPVIAVAQLNRGPEQRTDKRPLLADLRESGCVTADTTLLRADTGAPVTIKSLLENGHQDVLVWSVDDQHRLVPAPVTNVFAAGIKDVFRLRLASGREVKASGNHPFLTAAGWVPLEDLASGHRIAIPRHVPEPLGAGLVWAESHHKGLPEVLYSASSQEISVFLRHLWATDGCVWNPSRKSTPKASPRTFCREAGVHGRRGLLRCAAALNSPLPRSVATTDVFWDRVESITPLGPQPVYDATVEGTHNFVADGILAHNSIEQDSDVVILLHREDAYERESPRAGEADFIVAKHRNGPTATVTVAFQGHYSRFVDMAVM